VTDENDSEERTPGIYERVHSGREAITLHFELERAAGAFTHTGWWDCVSLRAEFAGGNRHYEESTTYWLRWASEFSYAGPLRNAREMGLRINLETGEWDLSTPGFAEQPFLLRMRGAAYEGDPRRVEPKNSDEWMEWVLSTNFRGDAPRRPSVIVAHDVLDRKLDQSRGPNISIKTSSIVLQPEFEDVELRVKIEDYKTWLPANTIEPIGGPGARLVARAELASPSGGATPKARSFRFELMDVTREPGVAMNWPENPPTDPEPPDLRFAQGSRGRLGKEALTWEVDARGNEAEATIESLDFGGAAILRVFCELTDGRTLVGVLDHEGRSIDSIPLPYRRVGSRIAEAWRQKHGIEGADGSDLDSHPIGDGNEGDGFSNYEEYRGFAYNGRHRRTDPGRKDLFIHNAFGPSAIPGIRLLSEITGLVVHRDLRFEEMDGVRKMNARRSASSPRSSGEFQHALILGRLNSGDASYADMQGDLWRPKYASAVYVLAWLSAPGGERLLAATIAHELLHAIGTRHHGEVDKRNVAWLRVQGDVNGAPGAWFEERPAWINANTGRYTYSANPGTRIRIFANPSQELLPVAGVLDSAQLFWVGCHGGQHSGFVDCVMRYDCSTAYMVPARPRDRFISPGEPIGMGLCESATGTDFNDAALPLSRYANANRGNCAHQFCVRDDGPLRPPAPAPAP